jgi:hypothetical protein
VRRFDLSLWSLRKSCLLECDAISCCRNFRTLLRNVGIFLLGYRATQPRRRKSSNYKSLFLSSAIYGLHIELFPIECCCVLARLYASWSEGSCFKYWLRYRVATLKFAWYSLDSFSFIYVLLNDIVSNSKYTVQNNRIISEILVKLICNKTSNVHINVTLRRFRVIIVAVEKQ